MERLLYFFYQYRAFFTFLMLEILAGWLIIQNNQYQSTRYFNTSNRVVANLVGVSQGIREYFSLRLVNEDLARENTILRNLIEQQNQIMHSGDSLDSSVVNRFDFIQGKVVNNSISRFKNYITIDQGAKSGIKAGMAVVSTRGVVGKVKSASDHFAVIISLLNVDEYVSSAVKRTNHFGTIHWDGVDPRITNLEFIPRHVKLAIGDSVVTSGYNAVFPPGVLIGVIKEVTLQENAPFYTISVELAQDFSKLAFVRVIKSNLKSEADSLEYITIGDPK